MTATHPLFRTNSFAPEPGEERVYIDKWGVLNLDGEGAVVIDVPCFVLELFVDLFCVENGEYLGPVSASGETWFDTVACFDSKVAYLTVKAVETLVEALTLNSLDF